MRQVDEANLGTEVVLGTTTVVTLEDLLPLRCFLAHPPHVKPEKNGIPR